MRWARIRKHLRSGAMVTARSNHVRSHVVVAAIMEGLRRPLNLDKIPRTVKSLKSSPISDSDNLPHRQHYRDIIPSAGTTGSLLNLRARAQHYMRDIRIEVIQ